MAELVPKWAELGPNVADVGQSAVEIGPDFGKPKPNVADPNNWAMLLHMTSTELPEGFCLSCPGLGGSL